MELTEYLLKQPGVQYFLSEKLTQDPLEAFFGHQRASGGYNDNPNTSTLRVQKSSALDPVRGNCRKRKNITTNIDDTPIPKRPRRKS